MTKKITKKTEEKKQQQLDRVSSSKRLMQGIASSKQSRKLSPATQPSAPQQQYPPQKESALKQVRVKNEPEEEKIAPSKVELMKPELLKSLIKVETIHVNPAPKQACSAYIYFSAETQRREKGTKTIIEIAKTTGERWKQMSAEEKQPYIDLARQDIER